MLNKFIYNYFLLLFGFIPFTILVGSSLSLLNIILIDLSFVILILYLKDFSFLKKDTLKYFYILILYLFFNSLISLDSSIGLSRNLGFLRVVIFFLAFNYFFKIEFFFRKVLIMWSIIISIVVLDVFIEGFFGQNILGFKSDLYGRKVSFFKDEHIVGGYIYGFFLIIIGNLMNEHGAKYKYYILFFSFVILVAIISTGERANSIKALLGFLIFFFLIAKFDFKKKIFSSIIGLVVILSLVFNSEFLKLRFYDQIKSSANNNNIYFKIYKSGFEVFKKYPILGVGNKNYRVETCDVNKQLSTPDELYKKIKYVCQTHPHQIYFEFLSEHGIIGTLVLFYIFYKLIFSKIKIVLHNRNYLQIGSLIYLLLIFLPLLPSGAFFSDFSITFFSLNISILYATYSKMNIFNNNKII